MHKSHFLTIFYPVRPIPTMASSSYDPMHRALEEDSLAYKMVVCIFGLLVLWTAISLSRGSRRAQEQERAQAALALQIAQQQEIMEAVTRRTKITEVMKDRLLCTELHKEHFKKPGSNVTQGRDDHEVVQEEASSSKLEIEDGDEKENVAISLEPVVSLKGSEISETTQPKGESDVEVAVPCEEAVTEEESKSPSLEPSEQGDVESPVDTADVLLEDTPIASVVVPTTTGSLSVSNGCAICLEPYKEGEVVAWSGNPSCVHAFHRECILEYMVPYSGDTPPCPCCREVFFKF
eukprot:Nitzschia sp. Nitz4//scaffold111_size72815//5088//6051//NITZ4_005776-RA/size72815-snap-gene-0.105-mRNA-1//-1//CDS//3329533138//5999//frame0